MRDISIFISLSDFTKVCWHWYRTIFWCAWSLTHLNVLWGRLLTGKFLKKNFKEGKAATCITICSRSHHITPISCICFLWALICINFRSHVKLVGSYGVPPRKRPTLFIPSIIFEFPQLYVHRMVLDRMRAGFIALTPTIIELVMLCLEFPFHIILHLHMHTPCLLHPSHRLPSHSPLWTEFTSSGTTAVPFKKWLGPLLALANSRARTVACLELLVKACFEAHGDFLLV